MVLAAVAIDSLAVKNVRPETEICLDGCYSSVLTSRPLQRRVRLAAPLRTTRRVPSGTNILSVTQKIWVKISILF